jgi:hypothetical protein
MLTLRERLVLKYALTPKKHHCYLIYIPQDGVCKIGRTSRLHWRLNNLRTALYRPHEVYVIHCQTPHESLMLERYFKKQLSSKHIVGEWYRQVTPNEIQGLLVMPDYGHLLLVPHEGTSKADIPKAQNERLMNFDIRLL